MANEKRLIDANAFIAKYCVHCGSGCDLEDECCTTVDDLMKAPTVDAVEVVHGRWIYEPVEFDWKKDIKCSVCGEYVNYASNYCPNCGAKMDLKGDNYES